LIQIKLRQIDVYCAAAQPLREFHALDAIARLMKALRQVPVTPFAQNRIGCNERIAQRTISLNPSSPPSSKTRKNAVSRWLGDSVGIDLAPLAKLSGRGAELDLATSAFNPGSFVPVPRHRGVIELTSPTCRSWPVPGLALSILTIV
jgi:hypothetical protein